VAGKDDAIDPGRDFETTSHPSWSHQRGHRNRQDGNLGHKSSTWTQFVEHLPQCELGQSASDEEEAGESVRGR
jgi:hypothetical protein